MLLTYEENRYVIEHFEGVQSDCMLFSVTVCYSV